MTQRTTPLSGLVVLCAITLILFYVLVVGVSPTQSAPTAFSLTLQGHPLQGSPTLSASRVDSILAHYGSPASGSGPIIYADSLSTGIDDAYALAFFMHESSFGTTGVARATRSFGNIRCTAGYSCLEGFRSYSNWQTSIDDWFSLIKNGYFTGQVSSKCPCLTVEQIIPVYAPNWDHNNESAYITSVIDLAEKWRSGQM